MVAEVETLQGSTSKPLKSFIVSNRHFSLRMCGLTLILRRATTAKLARRDAIAKHQDAVTVWPATQNATMQQSARHGGQVKSKAPKRLRCYSFNVTYVNPLSGRRIVTTRKSLSINPRK